MEPDERTYISVSLPLGPVDGLALRLLWRKAGLSAENSIFASRPRRPTLWGEHPHQHKAAHQDEIEPPPERDTFWKFWSTAKTTIPPDTSSEING